MFLAIVAAAIAVVLSLIVSSNRKTMIENDNDRKTEPKQIASAPKAPVAAAKEVAPKNIATLNHILDLGCFFFVAALFSFYFFTDSELFPVISIICTLTILFASWLVRAFVPFLRNSAIYFNVTALVTFVFWPSSISELSGNAIDGNTAWIISSSIVLITSIISAVVFKNRALWHFCSIMLTILLASIAFCVGKDYIPSAHELDKNTTAYQSGIGIAYYIVPIFSMIFAIACYYIWKSKSNIPVPMRAAVRFSVYFHIATTILATISAREDMLSGLTCPFLPSIVILLILLMFTIGLVLQKKGKRNFLAFRLILQALIIAITMDIDYSFNQFNEEIFSTVIAFAFLISGIIQAVISCVLMAKHPNEKCHSRERFVLAAAIASIAAAQALFCSISDTGIWASKDSLYYSPNDSSQEGLCQIAHLFGYISPIISTLFCIYAIFSDRNARMLVPAALLLSSIIIQAAHYYPAGDITYIPTAAAAFIFGILSVGACFSYYAIKGADKETSVFGSTIACSAIFTLFSYAYCFDGDYGWLPILLLGINFAFFGSIKRKKKLVSASFYTTAFGISLMLTSLGSHFTDFSPDTNSAEALINLISSAIFAGSFILRDYTLERFRPYSKPENRHIRFIIGALLFWLLSDINCIDGGFYLPETGAEIAGTIMTIIFRVAIFIYAMRVKPPVITTLSVLAIIATVINSLSSNIWIWLLLISIAVIGFAVFGIYRAYKKTALDPQGNPAPAAPENKPKANTEIQSEKTKDAEEKKLA